VWDKKTINKIKEVNFLIQPENDIKLTREELEQLIQEKKDLLKELEQYGKDSNYFKELIDLALLQLTAEYYTEAEKNYLLCLQHFQNIKDRLGQSALYGVLGTLYFQTEDFQKSIDNYNQAYKVYKELNQVQEQITCLIGIGNSLIKLNKLDEACDTLLDCAAICSDNNDIYHLLDCLGNLIHIHETQEKWDVVFELYLKSLEAFKELRDNKGIIVTSFNLGIIQKKSQKYEEALDYFKIGTNIAIDANYAELIIRGLGYVGETLFYLGKVRDAKDQFVRALRLADKMKAKNAIIQLRILLKSLGLSEEDIENELN